MGTNIEIYKDFVTAWNTLNAELIVKHIAESFRYDSEWVLASLDRDGYINYIRGKFHTIKNSKALVKAELVQNTIGEIAIRLTQKNNIAIYRIKIENGKVIKADLNSL